MRRARALAAVALVAVVAPVASALAPCGDWQQVFPWPTDAWLYGVTYGDGRFVVVGGATSTSEDGVVWTTPQRLGNPQLLGEELSLHHVVWNGQRFVAVGSHWVPPRFTSALAAASPDGSTWEVREFFSGSLDGMACAGPACVAVGTEFSHGSSLIFYSPDGEQWSPVTCPDMGALGRVAWGNGSWVAVGGGILNSTDGQSWEVVRAQETVWDVTWDGSGFLALAPGGVVASPDGETWTRLGAFPGDLRSGFIASNGRQLLVGGLTTDYYGVVATSTDGASWSDSVGTPGLVEGAVWAEGQWVAAGSSGLVGTSADGLDWRWHMQGGDHTLHDVACNGEELMAVGGHSTAYSPQSDILFSSEGVGWNDHSHVGAALNDLHWTGERWLAVGEHGTVVESPDGRDWAGLVSNPNPIDTWNAAASSPTGLVVAGVQGGWYGILAVMGDDRARHVPVKPVPGPLHDVLWTGSQFDVVGEGVTGWSEDGFTWSYRSVDASLAKLASDGHRVVAVGAGGAVLWSDDGRAWNVGQSGTAMDLAELTWAGDRFVAGTQYGTLLESADGETWAPAEPLPAALLEGMPLLEGLTWTGHELVAVTAEGAIARRRCGENDPFPASTPHLVVPVAAHRPGLGGTAWRSGLQVVSPGDHWSEVWVGFVPSGAESPTWQRFLLPPGGQLDRDDVVARTFGLEDAAGPLLVASEQPVAVVSRSFTENAAGTYGELFPGLSEADAVTGSAVLPMLEQDAAFRTNLGLTNLGSEAITVEIELFAASGALLGTREHELGPLDWVQDDALFAAVTTAPVADGYAVVSSDDLAARFLACASVVDDATGDPALVLPAVVSADALVVPAVAHGPGASGTFWRSDLEVLNPGSSVAEYRLELLAGEVVTSEPFALAPGEARRHADVVAALFGHAGSAALRVVPTAGAVAVTSRTFTVGPGGTFGQGVPAMAEGAAVVGTGGLVLAGLRESAAFRTNLGLVNPGDDELMATVELYRGDGGLAGRLTPTVPAHSLLLLTRAFARVGAGEVWSGYALVTADTPGARLLAWASVVDNATGDPSFVLVR